MNLTGFQLGVLYRPVPFLRLGVSYRSKVVVDGEGETRTTNPLSGEEIVLDTTSNFTNPHAFRAGFALSLAGDDLLLAGDFKYLMYEEAFETLDTTTTDADGVSSTTTQVLNWKDAFNIQLGAEYRFHPMLRGRLGYIMATTATDPAYALAFMAPPGVSHLGSVGLGLQPLESLAVDAAFAYVVVSSRVDTATEDNAGVGTYASYATQFALSLTYRI